MRSLLRRVKGKLVSIKMSKLSNTAFWNVNNVTSHYQFTSQKSSADYLDFRNAQYLFYEQLMPCSGFDNQVILDFGCGPGHDIAGFLQYSDPAKILAVDISQTSLSEAKARISNHPNNHLVEFVHVKENNPLPFKNDSVDYIHSSGVLHHTPNIETILQDFHRVLKPGGKIRIMVYNYESIWLHLYVAYVLRIKRNTTAENETLEESFRKSTDQGYAPISRCYKINDFIDLCSKNEFKTQYTGSAISIHELSLMDRRYEAIQNKNLNKEHREFLRSLTFDSFLRPMHNGNVAGIDAFFELTK